MKDGQTDTLEDAQAKASSLLNADTYVQSRAEAEVRKLNAEASLIEAQARSVRGEAKRRELDCESVERINSLQKLQIEQQIAKLQSGELDPPAN